MFQSNISIKIFLKVVLLNIFFFFNIVHSTDVFIDDTNFCNEEGQNNWHEKCESKCCCDRDILKYTNYFQTFSFLQSVRNLKSTSVFKNKLIEAKSQSPPKYLF